MNTSLFSYGFKLCLEQTCCHVRMFVLKFYPWFHIPFWYRICFWIVLRNGPIVVGKKLIPFLEFFNCKKTDNMAITSRIHLLTWAESFYCVKYRLSIIKSKVIQIISVNENTGVSVAFRTKRELECQNELFLKYHFSGNASLYVFITEIIWRTFDVIIDDP